MLALVSLRLRFEIGVGLASFGIDISGGWSAVEAVAVVVVELGVVVEMVRPAVAVGCEFQ